MKPTDAKRGGSPYEELSKGELLRILSERDDELRMANVFTGKKGGISQDTALQWKGRHRFLAERVRPVLLKPVASKSLHPERSDHMIINGDNLPVMYSLLPDLRGRVDVVYMDPPYNTGNEVFPYNDRFLFTREEVRSVRKQEGRAVELVSLDDPNRHTKWINHMAPRLWVAKKLLAPSGVIIVSIDEHELPRLWMLMEEIFDSKNRIATVVWERSRKNDSSFISEGHEYMLLWARNIDELKSLARTQGKWRVLKPGFEQHKSRFRELLRRFGKNYARVTEELHASLKGISKGHPLWTIRQYYHVDSRSPVLGPYYEEDPSWPGGGGPQYIIRHPKTRKPVRTPPKGWLIPKSEFQRLIDDDRIVWKGDGTPKIKKYLLEGRESEVQTSVIRDAIVQKDARGSVMLSKAIFGFENAYQNPKDHLVLKTLFSLVTWGKPDAIILDPYSGSGTTGHAVLAMNSEDAGHRRFIMIEGGFVGKGSPAVDSSYTDRYTATRIRNVISGRWGDKKSRVGLDSGFTFFEADSKGITEEDLLSAGRETLSDIILQVAEEESNRVDCRVSGHSFLIGRTRTGNGIALVWGPRKGGNVLDSAKLKDIAAEVEKEKCLRPFHVYASANKAPFADELYRFHQIPDSILARLGISGWEESVS